MVHGSRIILNNQSGIIINSYQYGYEKLLEIKYEKSKYITICKSYQVLLEKKPEINKIKMNFRTLSEVEV